ncbi:MAG: hypothetical protein AB1505_34740, partial [Candidatus Latescibacterota bacterium]
RGDSLRQPNVQAAGTGQPGATDSLGQAAAAPAPPARDPKAEAQRRRQLTEALLARVAGMTETLDAAWFAAHCEHVPDSTALYAYLTEVVELGQGQVPPPAPDTSRTRQRVRRQQTDQAQRQLREARGHLYKRAYGSAPSRRALEDGRRGLAAALHLAKEEAGSLEDIDPAFAASFFKEQTGLYEKLAETPGAAGGDTSAWSAQWLRTVEAAALDGYLRLQRLDYLTRQRQRVPVSSPGLRVVRRDQLERGLNEQLLRVGKARLEAARRETRDAARVQQHAQTAFDILAMVYRRCSSGEALQGMRQVSELQANYLVEMARASWRQAQQAAAAGDRRTASEHYFRATQRYNECLARAAAQDREELVAELVRLKQELRTWHGGGRGADTTRRTGT